MSLSSPAEPKSSTSPQWALLAWLRGWLGSAHAFLVLLARGNLLIALSMAASTWMVQVLAGLPVEPVAPLITFLVIYAIYSLDRVAELDADSHTHPERALFSQRHARLIRSSAVAAYALALVLAGAQGRWCVAVTLLPLAALLFYSFPFLPRPVARRVGFSRLKEVLLLKNLWVSGTLAATPTLLAVAVHGSASERMPLLAISAFLLGRWQINTLFFDVRDEAGDRANGLRTIPVVLGRARTLRLLHGLNGLLALLTLAVPLPGLARPVFALLGVSCLYAWAYLRRAESREDLHFLSDVVADGELGVLAIVVLLGTRT
jgi:4-hydroxybenzoate polyprenyltransferase